MNKHIAKNSSGAAKPQEADLYSYQFDLQSGRSASRVARLVGEGKTVLELGCGPGSQSKVFREALGCDVVGVELDPTRVQSARKYCRAVHVADLETANLGELLGEEKFDVVVCADILEHLRTPENLLLKVRTLLQPRGYVVVSIPNVTHAAIAYQLVRGQFDYRSEGLLDSTHVRFFSRASAISLLENSGYWIADFQKVRVLPEHTEFKTTPLTAEDRQLLEIIRSKNPEANTYQFVIKAYPLGPSNSSDDHVMSLYEALQRAQQDLRSYESELRRLQSILEWYRKPFLRRLFSEITSRRKRGLRKQSD